MTTEEVVFEIIPDELRPTHLVGRPEPAWMRALRDGRTIFVERRLTRGISFRGETLYQRQAEYQGRSGWIAWLKPKDNR